MDEAEEILPPGVSVQVNGGRKSGAKYRKRNNILFQSGLRDYVRKYRIWPSYTDSQRSFSEKSV